MAEPNLERAREAFDAFGRGDLEAYKDYFADDVVWHVSGNHPLSGSYRGKEALFQYFEKVRELTEGSLQIQPQAILADESHVGVFARVTAQRRGDRSRPGWCRLVRCLSCPRSRRSPGSSGSARWAVSSPASTWGPSAC